MLADIDLIEMIASRVGKYKLVIDPVMVATFRELWKQRTVSQQLKILFYRNHI